jgi:CRISPR/Cas system endoribonuclease Cas6 (RAMP superfamily)
MSLNLAPQAEEVKRIRVIFRTPTELKAHNEVVDRPEFPILYARASERVLALSKQPLELVPCPNVQLTDCSLSDAKVERRSSKTGQRHRIGGILGYATYQGPLRPCLPILQAAEFTGVGRHTSWGNGRLQITLLD